MATAARTAVPVRAAVDRDTLVSAALKLLGPSRSLSTLSLREVAREAGIAPMSFYRHFRDMDELALALIDRAGGSLRRIIREARQRLSPERSAIRTSVEAFMEQLDADGRLLHVLLREGSVGSDAFRRAVERELGMFEDELCEDLKRLFAAENAPLHAPHLVARAMTRLVFAMGGVALDLPRGQRNEIAEQMVQMLRMIASGAQVLASPGGGQPG